MKRCLCAAVLIPVIVVAAMGADTRSSSDPVYWAFRIGEANTWFPDGISDLATTPDSAFLAVGYSADTRDGWLVKFKADGTLLWQKAIGAPNTQEDYFRSLDQTADGGHIVGGGSEPANEDVLDAWMLRLKPNGGIAWSRRFSGGDEEFFKVFATTEEKFLGVGRLYSDSWAVKTDKSGKIVWQTQYAGDELDGDNMYAASEASDGGCLIAGSTGDYNSADVIAIRVGARGEIVWQKRLEGKSKDRIEASLQVADGGFLLAGGTKSFGATLDPWVVRMTSTGDVSWQYRYKGSADCIIKGIARTADGGFVLLGCAIKTTDLVLFKINSAGKLVWQKDYGYPLNGLSEYYPLAVMEVPGIGFLLAGDAPGFGGPLKPFGNPWMAMLDSTGGLPKACPPRTLKLTAIKTGAKVKTAECAAYDTSLEIRTGVKDEIAATNAPLDVRCE